MQRRVASHVHLAHVDLVSCHLIAEPVTNFVLRRESERERMVEADRRSSTKPALSKGAVARQHALALGGGDGNDLAPKLIKLPNPNDDLARHLSFLPAVKHGNT